MTDAPTITLPLPWVIDMLETYQAKTNAHLDRGAVIESDIGLAIKNLDPEEKYCHVHFDKATPSVCVVFTIRNWKQSAQKEYDRRARGEAERQYSIWVEQKVKEIVAKLRAGPIFSGFPDDELATKVALDILKNKNHAKAKMFDVDITYTP